MKNQQLVEIILLILIWGNLEERRSFMLDLQVPRHS